MAYATASKFPTLGESILGAAPTTYVAWTNPTNIYTNNLLRASGAFTSTEKSRALVASGFGISLPADAIPVGLEVTVRGHWSSGSGAVRVDLIRNKNNVSVLDGVGYYDTDGGAIIATIPATTAADVTTGSSTGWSNWDWGTLGFATKANFESANFAVVIQKWASTSVGTLNIDSVSVVLYYDSVTGPAGSKTFTSTVVQSSAIAPDFKRSRTAGFQSAEFTAYAPALAKIASPVSSGSRNPTTSSGTGWTAVANIYAQDGVSATIVPTTTPGSAPLKAQGFGFAIPSGATINGITYEAYAYQSGGTFGAIDVAVKALKADGTPSVTSATTIAIDTTASYKTYGGSTSLWGEAWTHADINDVDFGVQLTPTATGSGGGVATTTGYTNPATAASEQSTSGTTNWGSPANVYASDNTRSTYGWGALAGVAATAARHPYLNVTNFGLAIPTGATINAIEFSIERWHEAASTGNIRFNTVQIIKAGVRAGTLKSSATNWPTVDAYQAFGDITADLWGATLTPADVNASNFGVSIRAIGTDAATDGFANIDHVRVRVNYTPAASPDRTITVDHVRATVTYTPVDIGAKMLTFPVTESATAEVANFTRDRSMPHVVAETSATTTAVSRFRHINTYVDTVYTLAAEFFRQRNVPMALSIAQIEELAQRLTVVRSPVSETFSPMSVSEGTGTIGWTNIANIYAQDSAVAYIDPATSGNKPLRVTNFGYALVPAVNVLGVKFEAYAYQSGGTLGTVNVQAKLIKPDGTTTTASELITDVGTTPSYKTYGGPTSLWGEALIGASVNDVDFGVELTPIGIQAFGSPAPTALTNPSTATSEAGASGSNWTNPANVFAEDGVSARGGAIGDADATNWPHLNVTNFGFAIPATASIRAVEFSVSRFRDASAGQNSPVYWQNVQLIKAGVRTGTNKATAALFPLVSAYETFGDTTSDLWGNSLTVADVNATTFGVSLRPRYDNSNAFPGNYAYVDHVRCRVTYSTLDNPDRRLNVDHVRATVTYNPIDLKSLGSIVVAYLESFSPAFARARTNQTVIAQAETIAAPVKRFRETGGFLMAESTTITSALNRLKQIASALVETTGHSFTGSRARTVASQVDELSTFSFGALRRIRAVQTALAEAVNSVVVMSRDRALPFTVTQDELIDEAIQRSRTIAALLEEQLTVTLPLSRRKVIASTINEVQTMSAFFAKAKFMGMVVAHVETHAVGTFIRGRGIPLLMAEVHGMSTNIHRSRVLAPVIPQSEVVAPALSRFRTTLVQILEDENVDLGNLGRVRSVISLILEQEQFGFAVSIILGSDIPEVIGLTITWYEQEIKVDGTINFKLMSDTWEVRRTAVAVVIDLPIAPIQIIDL